MIAWSIAAAQAAGAFDVILVSTDDDEVAEVARACGAEAPFRRPAALADEFTPTLPVIAHALTWFEQNRAPVSLACCLYATAPFLQPEFLLQGRDLLREHPAADFAFSVTSYAFPILRALRIVPGGAVEMFWPENELRRSQDLPAALHDAGQFYWGRREAFLNRRGFFSALSYPVIIPRHFVQDIDTPEDWAAAEEMFRSRQLQDA